MSSTIVEDLVATRSNTSFFLDQIENRDLITHETGLPNILFVEIDDREVHGVFVEPPPALPVINREGNLERPYKEYLAKHFRVVIPPSDQVKAELIRLLHNRGIRFTAMEHDHTLTIVYFLLAMLPVTFVLSMWFSFRRARTLANENLKRSSDVHAP